jgi:hypothetical protein
VCDTHIHTATLHANKEQKRTKNSNKSNKNTHRLHPNHVSITTPPSILHNFNTLATTKQHGTGTNHLTKLKPLAPSTTMVGLRMSQYDQRHCRRSRLLYVNLTANFPLSHHLVSPYPEISSAGITPDPFGVVSQ